MKLLTHILALTLCVLTSSGVASATDFKRFRTYAKSNSDGWFLFGPAVIQSAKSIVLFDENQPEPRTKNPKEAKNYQVNEGDHNFSAVRNWILENFGDKLCFSEKAEGTAPTNFSGQVLRLYTQRPTYDDKSWDLLLIQIPISSRTLCMDETDAQKKYEELKTLMANRKTGSSH